MDVSIVIPLLNEAESIRELHAWIKSVCEKNHLTYEVLFIDDGSRDDSWQIISSLQQEDRHVRGIKFLRNYGKSAGLHIGFEEANGDVIITMDADLQDSPDEIPALVKMIREEGYDLVSGWKKKRYDPISKTIPTKLYNWATRRMSGVYLHDFNCGLKAYKSVVVKNIEIFGEMHRYIPVIAHREGFRKIGEKVVEHRARKYRTSRTQVWTYQVRFISFYTWAIGFAHHHVHLQIWQKPNAHLWYYRCVDVRSRLWLRLLFRNKQIPSPICVAH